MSAWAVFTMMGFYPDCPGSPYYTITTPTFDRVRIRLDESCHGAGELGIEKQGAGEYIDSMELGGRRSARYRVLHDELLKAEKLTIKTK